MQVGNGEVLVELVLTVHVDNLAEDAHRASQLICVLGCSLYGYTDNNLSTHLTGNVGRIVVFQTTIDQHFVADSHGCEGGRNGHRGTHGLRQPAAVEIDLAVVDDVCSHTGKGNRKVAGEVNRIGVTHTEPLEQFSQILALDDAARLLVVLAGSYAHCI